MTCQECTEKGTEIKRLKRELELSRYQVVAAMEGQNKLLGWAMKVVRQAS